MEGDVNTFLTPQEIATNKLETILLQWKRQFINDALYGADGDEDDENAEIRFDKNAEIGYEYDVDDANEKIGDVETVAELLRNGADMDVLERQREISCIPCVFWNKKLIKFCIENGRNINQQDENGDTALSLFYRWCINTIRTYRSEIKCVSHSKYLLEMGSDPNTVNREGNNAIIVFFENYSCFENNLPENIFNPFTIIFQLRDRKITDRQNNFGEHILHFSNAHSIKFTNIERFVDARTCKHLYTKMPLMLLSVKFSDSKYKTRPNNYHSMWESLIKAGANINATDLQGFTALHHSAAVKNWKVIGLLTKQSSVNLNIRSTQERDVCDVAALNGFFIYREAIMKLHHQMFLDRTRAVARLKYPDNMYFIANLSEELEPNYCSISEPYSSDMDNATAIRTIYQFYPHPADFWNVITAMTPADTSDDTEVDSVENIPEILGYIERTMTLSPLLDYSTIEEMDLNSLVVLIDFVKDTEPEFPSNWFRNIRQEDEAQHSRTSTSSISLKYFPEDADAIIVVFCGESETEEYRIFPGGGALGNAVASIVERASVFGGKFGQVLLQLVEEIERNRADGILMSFRNKLNNFVQFHSPLTAWIGHVHRLAKLTISCLNKWISLPDTPDELPSLYSPELPCHYFKSIYFQAFVLLTRIHSYYRDFIPAQSSGENVELIRTMMQLNPRDEIGNTLLHEACSRGMLSDLGPVDVLLDFRARIGSPNRYGFQPFQMISPFSMYSSSLMVINRMLESGSHFDARNVDGDSLMPAILTRTNVLMYDSLECMCARVLRQSHVPYRDILATEEWRSKYGNPDRILRFINQHGLQ